MAGPSVSNTFANSTTADATQVNQNFTDLINGMTDGTKDFSINAITCAGTATFNGNVNIGNASGDDLTITASLASSLSIKTTFSYDIGSSAIGLRSIYFGESASNARGIRVIAPAVASSYTFTLPSSGGTSRYRLQTDGSGTTSWDIVRRQSDAADNIGLAASVSGNALTIALKGADGNDPSSTNPVDIVFRSSTAATGTATVRTVTAAVSVTLSSGSTLGHADGKNGWIYVYAIDNAGTVELAVAGQAFLDEGSRQSTTAEGGAGAADSNLVLYSTTARSNIGIRYIGRMKSSQTTAGTWASGPTEISCGRVWPQQNRSYVRLSTQNGHGATNTKIRRFTTALDNYGTAITYADSSANGASFTINEDGLYNIVYEDWGTGNMNFGISLNSTQLTTAISSITDADRIMDTWCTAGNPTSVAATIPLRAGDVIRPHTDGTINANASEARFIVTKVGN